MSIARLAEQVRSVIVICPSWVGDTVMLTPSLRALREQRPQARIIAVARPGVETLLAGCPWIDERLGLSMKGGLGPWRAARRLRSLGAEAAILYPNSFRTAMTVRIAGVRTRIGYDRDGRGGLLTDRVAVPSHEHPTPAIDYYLHLTAHALGVEASTLDRRMQLFVTPEEQADADVALKGSPPRFALLNPGGNKTAKRWPAERFAAVADALHERLGLSSIVSGSPSEADLLEAIVTAARSPVTSIAGPHLNLGSLKAIVQRAAIMITNDTGPRHIAAALGVPVVTLFGPTDHRWTTLGTDNERLLLAEPFLPETIVADAQPRLCRIERIGVEDVIAASLELLGGAT